MDSQQLSRIQCEGQCGGSSSSFHHFNSFHHFIIIIIIIIVKHPHFNQPHHPHSPFSSLPRFSLRRDIYHLSTLVDRRRLGRGRTSRRPSFRPEKRRVCRKADVEENGKVKHFYTQVFQDGTWFQLPTFFKYPPKKQVPYPTNREKEHHRLETRTFSGNRYVCSFPGG